MPSAEEYPAAVGSLTGEAWRDAATRMPELVAEDLAIAVGKVITERAGRDPRRQTRSALIELAGPRDYIIVSVPAGRLSDAYVRVTEALGIVQ